LPAAAASVDGIDMHWTSSGSGPQTLFFVHGWTCDDTSWSAQVPVLSKKYRVLTLDLPHPRGAATGPAPRFLEARQLVEVSTAT
jgi:pimeloyl-ACP methyl ester carboxylesterase